MFSLASIGSPAVICPTRGIGIISWLRPKASSLMFDKISIALGLVGSLLMYPNFSSLFKWPWTVDVDFSPTAAHISLTEGG